MKDLFAYLLAAIVFAGCLVTGFWQAGHKPLWTDEYFSQVSSIQQTSYEGQLTGHIPEGANAPLFYTLQKSFLGLIGYQTSPAWIKGQWTPEHVSQIVLRINPVVCMSLSVVLVFYYSFRRYSLWIGLLSLFIYISSHMLWTYWAEARPYALLVFLTTIQSLLFLKKTDPDSKTTDEGLWMVMAGVNILLAFTSIMSFGQIIAATFLWWAFGEQEWKKYIPMTIIPVLIILFYFIQAPKYHFYFGLSPEQLIRDNMPRDRFDVLFMFFGMALIYGAGRKNRLLRDLQAQELSKPVPYVVFTLMVLAFTAGILGLFAMTAVKEGQGFAITSRYFIYLTPIGVIATTLLAVSLTKTMTRYQLLKWAFWALLAFLFLQRFMKTVPGAIHSILRG